MKNKIRLFQSISRGFIIFPVLCLLSVSLMAPYDPQIMKDLVQVRLTSNDAYSSVDFFAISLSLFLAGRRRSFLSYSL